MKYIRTEIPDVFIVEPCIFHDGRGYFFESFVLREFEEEIGNVHFVQENQSSSSLGVLRGLHFQKPPHAQAKLVSVVVGKAWDVAVDLRRNSPTFGRHVGVELSAENQRRLFIPRGFAHGFITLAEGTVFQYKCDNYYAPLSEGGIRYDDPDIAIRWPECGAEPNQSAKDLKLPYLRDFESPFF